MTVATETTTTATTREHPARRLLDLLGVFAAEGAAGVETLRAAEDFTPEDAFILARMCGALDRYFRAVHRAERRAAAGEVSTARLAEAEARDVFRELTLLLEDPDSAGPDVPADEDPAAFLRRLLTVFGLDPVEALDRFADVEGVTIDDTLALGLVFEEVGRYFGAATSLLVALHSGCTRAADRAEAARRRSLARVAAILTDPEAAL